MIVLPGDVEDEDNGPNFKRKAEKAGFTVRQCEKCRGSGYVSARLLVSMAQLSDMAKTMPNAPVPVAKETCPDCDGRGSWIV